MRHVGNVYTHFPESVLESSYGERVVEVLGIAGVDGAGEDIAEVFPLVEVFLRHLTRDFLGNLFHVLG